MKREVSLTPVQRRAVKLMGAIAVRQDGSSGREVTRPHEDLAELDDPGPEFSPENLVGEIAAYPFDSWDSNGARIRLSDLPPSSENLTRSQARAIFESFKDRISRNLTSGISSSHFEQYVLYAIGRREPLSGIQRDLAVWLCIAMRRRPLPGLWSAQFVFENIDNPKIVRRVIAANLWSQQNYHKRLVDAFTDWRSLITPPDRQVRLLAIGYSDSIVSMLEKIAEAADHTIIAYVPDLRELGREQSADDFYRKRLWRSTKIDIQTITSDHVTGLLSRHKIDIAFLSSKVISATDCNTTRIVESAACINIVRQVRASGSTSRWKIPPLLVAGAIFKIWPARLYKQYFSSHNDDNQALLPTDDAILRGDEVAQIVTDIGCISPRDLRRLPSIAYRLHTENFATATALHLYQTDSRRPIDRENNPVRERGAGEYLFVGRDNEFPLLTERDCIILQTIRPESKDQNDRDTTDCGVFTRQDHADVEKGVKEAKSYLLELLTDDAWYHEHKGQYIAVSARPRGYVTAPNLSSLRKRREYGGLGTWYRCRVDRDEANQAIAISPRTRLLISNNQ